jgi:hypothetical protein
MTWQTGTPLRLLDTVATVIIYSLPIPNLHDGYLPWLQRSVNQTCFCTTSEVKRQYCGQKYTHYASSWWRGQSVSSTGDQKLKTIAHLFHSHTHRLEEHLCSRNTQQPLANTCHQMSAPAPLDQPTRHLSIVMRHASVFIRIQ